MEWIELAFALAAFFLSHRVPAMFGLKARIVAAFGPRGYVALFSVLSLGLLWWVIVAAGRAPYVELWGQPDWSRWLVNLAMPVAILLGTFGVAAPNPFAFEGRAQGFDPDRPGIAGLTRQPLLWALAIWAAAHLSANGDLAHVLLFGPMLVLALIGAPAMEARTRARMGTATWDRLAARTALIPLAALAKGRWRPTSLPSLPRLLAALAIWAGLWHLHEPLIGLWPGP
jgi:uncharacterized membrane protein